MQGYERFICSILQGESVTWPASEEWAENDFFETCQQHGVAGLVYYSLKKTGDLGQFTESLRARLKKHYLQASAVELRRASSLAEVITTCFSGKVFPLLLKGGALSYTHYPLPGLRERCDTDLFIRFEDIQPFLEVMRKLGYAVGYPIYKSHQVSCVHSQTRFSDSFDVHWRISNFARFARVLDFDEVVARSVPVSQIPGARALDSKDALLLACMHLATNPWHAAGRLIWIYDVHLLASAMQSGELLAFARLAVSKQVQDVCRDALEKSRRCFHTSLPGAAMELLSSPLPKLNFYEKFERSNLGLIWNDLNVLPGMPQKLSLLKELFFPPRQYLLCLYGTKKTIWLPWLYLRHLAGGAAKRLTLR